MSACVCACLRECRSVCVRVCECVHPLASYTAIISVTLIKRWGPGAGLGPDTPIKSVCGRARRCQHRLVFKSDSFSSGSFPSPSSFNHWPTPFLAQTKPCHTRAPTPSSHLCTVCRPLRSLAEGGSWARGSRGSRCELRPARTRPATRRGPVRRQHVARASGNDAGTTPRLGFWNAAVDLCLRSPAAPERPRGVIETRVQAGWRSESHGRPGRHQAFLSLAHLGLAGWGGSWGRALPRRPWLALGGAARDTPASPCCSVRPTAAVSHGLDAGVARGHRATPARGLHPQATRGHADVQKPRPRPRTGHHRARCKSTAPNAV